MIFLLRSVLIPGCSLHSYWLLYSWIIIFLFYLRRSKCGSGQNIGDCLCSHRWQFVQIYWGIFSLSLSLRVRALWFQRTGVDQFYVYCIIFFYRLLSFSNFLMSISLCCCSQPLSHNDGDGEYHTANTGDLRRVW